MKRKSMTFVHYLQLHLVLGMPMALCVDAQQDRVDCPEVTYLEVGKEGIISCSLEPFYAVSWYTKEDYDEEKSPVLYFNGNKHGRVDEYDVHPNGSFIFRNVSLNHAGRYIVTMLRDVTSDLLDREVYVGIYVTPNPTYPVVEGRITQQHVYMDANRNGQLNCSMRHVYPNISLLWTVVDPTQSKKILFQEDVVERKQNEDNTFDITLTSPYAVTDQSVRRITIQCGVANEIGEVLSSRTKVDLLFSSVYPVVNGHFNQKHIYLDVDREGQLTCIKENVDAGTTLVWKIVDTSMQGKITFQSRAIVLESNDGTVTINQTFVYEIHDNLLDRITIECEVVTSDTDDIPVATKVDLLLQNAYPVVNGHVNQRHVYLDVDRMGHLSCVKKNAGAESTLDWVVDPTLHDKIMFESSVVISNNSDGTVNINKTFDYEVRDHSLDRITIECKIVEPDTDEHSLATKVDLLFQNVYPVVNGHVNQKHVYLDVDRMGHLSCMKENVDVGTRLVWVLDPTLRGKVTFQSSAITRINIDGTVNINQTFDYEVHDNFLERISVECRLIEPDTEEYRFSTTVDLLFSSALLPSTDPVISGCYHQPHECVLEVGRSGELTCTVKNSHYQVDLRWTTLDRDKTNLVFENTSITLHNSTNLYDASITTSYTVVNKSVTSVTVQCDACTSDSGQVLATAKTSLVIQPDRNKNSCTCCTPFDLSVFTLLMVAACGLLGLIQLYFTRRIYKMAMKMMKLLEALCVPNGNHEGTTFLMVAAENGDTAGSSDSDSGKGSGEDNGLDNNEKMQPLLSERGQSVKDEMGNEDEESQFRRTKKDRLVKTILKVFQLLYKKYLSDEGKIEDAVAIINEQEKDEDEME